MPQVIQRQMPELLPVPSGNLKDKQKEMRKVFGDPVPGTSTEIDAHLVEVREYAKFAIAFWTSQLEAADLELILASKNAEFLTVNGVPVLKQYAEDMPEHNVKATVRRGFRAVNR